MKTFLLVLTAALVWSATSASFTLANWISDPSVFEPTYYADHNKDVEQAVGYDNEQLLHHWGKYGIKDGRAASPAFDVRYYLKNNPDVAKSVGKDNFAKAIEHWYNNGRKEGRPSHPDFHVKRYLELNEDVARRYGEHNYIEAINHYLREGYEEGRKAI